MRSWSRTKNVDAGWEKMGEIAASLGGTVNKIPGSNAYAISEDVSDDADVSNLSLEDILEAAGGQGI